MKPEKVPRSRRRIPDDIAYSNDVRKMVLHNPIMEYVDSMKSIERYHANYDFLPWLDTPGDMLCQIQEYQEKWLACYFHADTHKPFAAKFLDYRAPAPPTLEAHRQPKPWAGIPPERYERG